VKRKKVIYWLILLLLIGLGFAGNIFKVTLFYNVDLIFGSFFVMLIISLYGPVWGGIAGVIAASYTYVLWNHPYAIIIFTCEALFVGIIFQRRKDNLVYIDIIYWFILGMPLVYLFYRAVMGMDNTASVLIVLKQAVNGILNALLARLLLMLLGKRGTRLYANFWNGRWRFTNVLSNTIIGFVLLPVISFTAISGWLELREIDRELTILLEEKIQSASHLVNTWIEASKQEAASFSYIVEDALSVRNGPAAISRNLQQMLTGRPDVLEVWVVDRPGEVFAYANHEGEEGTILPILAEDIENWLPSPEIEIYTKNDMLVPDTERSIILRAPFSGPDGTYTGNIFVRKYIRQLQSYLQDFSMDRRVDYIITCKEETVLTKTVDTAEKYYRFLEAIEQKQEAGITRWLPSSKENTSVMERWKDAIHIADTGLSQAKGWKLYSFASLAPYQERIYADSLNKLLILMALIFLTAILSRVIAVRYVKPIKALQKITTDLPKKIHNMERPEWPRSMAAEISNLISNFQNMTGSLKRAFSDLREEKNKADTANLAKSRFLANMSHDIRTPITAIKGMVDILLEHENLDESSREDIETIRESSEVLLGILNNILDLSKIEAGKLTIEKVDTDIRRIIGGIIRLFQGSAHLKNITLSSVIDPAVPRALRVDPLRIQQVLMNLLGNALKFTEQGEIVLDVRVGKEFPGCNGSNCVPLVISVRDTGTGIAEDKQKIIFESFSQADTSTTRKFGGSGLGLTISKELITLMGGEIFLESSPGAGSVFSFTLPAEPGGENSARNESSTGPASVSTDLQAERNLNFLVADDNAINRKVAERILKNLDVRAALVSNGIEVLTALQRERFDVVLMDLQMPGMGGLEAAERIRAGEAGEENKTIPIIALSASGESAEAEQSRQAGMDDYIAKPLTAEAVIQILERCFPAE
jgi:signal transduction histidine kinase/CheY-like chemotaxis protein